MQDLVAIGVADARKQIRIGQRAFNCVVARQQSCAELIESSVQRLQPAAIVLSEGGLATQQVNRCTLFLRGLSEQQRAVGEVEGSQADLARDCCTLFLPPEAPRDHQVDEQKQ